MEEETTRQMPVTPCDPQGWGTFLIDTKALVSAWEEATNCPWLWQGQALTPCRVITKDRELSE